MHDNKIVNRQYIAEVFQAEMGNLLGQISIVGDPIQPSEWINCAGPLQPFEIVNGREDLRMIWADQDEVLLRTIYWQRLIKIITFPSEGEDEGYLNYTGDSEPSPQIPSGQKLRWATQRGLAYLQSKLFA